MWLAHNSSHLFFLVTAISICHSFLPACGEPRPDETSSPPTSYSKELDSQVPLSYSFSPLLFLSSFVLCFHCLFAVLVHLPVVFPEPFSTWSIYLKLECYCIVGKLSNTQKSHQGSNPCSSNWWKKSFPSTSTKPSSHHSHFRPFWDHQQGMHSLYMSKVKTVEGFQQEWYMCTMIYSQDIPFWSETLLMFPPFHHHLCLLCSSFAFLSFQHIAVFSVMKKQTMFPLQWQTLLWHLSRAWQDQQ